MGKEADAWAAAVQKVAEKRGLKYEPVGGINPVDQPAALCVGGTNRITGELSDGFWGSACDADEVEKGGFKAKIFGGDVVPEAMLAKAHMPDLAKVLPGVSIESIEARPSEFARKHATRNQVNFESIDFNKKYLVSVPEGHDPIAVRELFSPKFLDWMADIDHEVDLGVAQEQLWFLWRYKDRGEDDLEAGLKNAGELFERVHWEMDESGYAAYPPGPWHAGMEPFPASPAKPSKSA